MPSPSLLPADHAVYDLDLLKLLRGRRLSRQLRTLCVIGAHRLDEWPLIQRLFPALQRVYVFEPQPAPLQRLRELAAGDPRLMVFAMAVSDRDGEAEFHVTSNDGESSSLLALGSHRELFPEVRVRDTIVVPTRRIDSLLADRQLPPPDVVIVDVQGAEHAVLSSFGAALMDRVRLIYTEVSTEAVYAGSRALADVESLLAPRFVNLGFAAMRADVPMHGNAVFVAGSDVDAALSYTLAGRLRAAWHRRRQRRQQRQLR